jgi:hypothetical protein
MAWVFGEIVIPQYPSRGRKYTNGPTKMSSVEIVARDAVDKGVDIILAPSYGGDVMGLYNESLLNLYSSSSSVLVIDFFVV